jgi:hypothetical protein
MVAEIQADTQMVLNTLRKIYFQDAFQKQQQCWDRRVGSQGDLFQGDGAE